MIVFKPLTTVFLVFTCAFIFSFIILLIRRIKCKEEVSALCKEIKPYSRELKEVLWEYEFNDKPYSVWKKHSVSFDKIQVNEKRNIQINKRKPEEFFDNQRDVLLLKFFAGIAALNFLIACLTMFI